ncbi:MAG: RHS repeat-associated core domain-containing protein, partial [Casimicrobiaceae bacterium]
TYFLIPDVNHFVSVTLPSGRVETFDVQLSPTTSLLQQFSTLQATFVPRAGVQGTLQSLDNTNLLIADAQPGPITLIDDTTLNTFNPDRFIYTERDGTQFVVTRSHGVESVKDTNGNQISITPGGISHSSGTNIVFDRDAAGRIVGITDPAGNKRAYAYTANGDLGAATDRTSNTTRYTYDAQHNVLRIDDPLGRPAARADYDVDGRLVALTDAAGHTTYYNHDLPGRQEQITDALGRTRVLNYDERGNVLSATDPLGNTTIKTYDAQDNLLSETDPLGATTSHAYDAQRNLVSTTDRLGRLTSHTYDAAGRLLTSTGARGFTTTTTYDAKGNPTRSADALGNAMQSSFDANGNRTSITDPNGATTLNQYDGAGRRTQVSDPADHTVVLQYDAAGNLLGQSGAGIPAVSLSYDVDGRIVGTASASGARSIVRDPTGAAASATTSAGAAVLVNYDPAGRFAGLTDATSGSNLRQQTYDDVGNLTSITDAAGNATAFVYDANNRLVATTAANGASTQNAYDAAGNLVSKTDTLGNTTHYQYDAAGQTTAVIDPVGHTTQFQYDLDGNVIARIDATGRTTALHYDDAGRQIGTTYPDDSQESTTYDASGNVLTKTDAAGHVTTYAYDSLQRLTAVTDPLGHVSTLHYDGSAAASLRVDANGHATQFAYDDHGRLVQTIHPLGDSATALYDDAGRTLRATNGAGEATSFEYDTQGRVSVVTHADHATATYTYTGDGLVASIADSHGATAYQYDALTRQVTRVTEPDGRYVRYGYDIAGRRTLLAHGDTHAESVTTYAYDALGHIVQVTAPDAGVTLMTYYASGNLATMIRADGVKTTYTYDMRDRPLVIEQRDAVSALLSRETYTLDLDGNRTRIDYADSTHVEYQYDALDRIVRERHFASGGTLQSDLVYAYDAVGNRIASGPATAPVAFSYNANDQLVSGGGVSYAYDAAGRRTQESWTVGAAAFQRRYQWDGEDRLIAFDDSSVGTSDSYQYDDYGERIARSDSSGATSFLTDRAGMSGFSQLLRARASAGDATYVWSGGNLISVADPVATHYPLSDALSSTQALADAGGAISDRYAYDAFGQLTSHVGSTSMSHQFAGEQNDAESGLVYLRARYYDPRTGVFLTRDPAEGNPFDPVSMHPYLYASANPVNRIDPSGRETLLELINVQSIDTTVEKGEEIQAVRNLEKRAETVTAAVMRDTGAILAVEALVDATQNRGRVVKWFGGVLGLGGDGAAPKALDLAARAAASPAGATPAGSFFGMAIGATTNAVTLAAELALGKAAFDMFNLQNVTIQIQVGLAAPSSAFDTRGNKTCWANRAYHAVVDRSDSIVGSTWYLALCTPFFSDTPLPVAGKISMAGVMVHEFMHITSNRLIRDDGYGCATGLFGKRSAAEILRSELPGASLFNADSYRCWVEDAALNFGNARLAARLPAP